MPSNKFPGIGYKYGRDHNLFQKITVDWTTFGGDSVDGYQPDIIIPFTTAGILFLNEGSSTVEYSFNGRTVHGELVSGTPSAGLTFDNRVVSMIWFRVASGSTVVRVDAWSTR
jgi:hypothetical protein